MAVAAVTGEAPPPMPERGRAWSVYDLFETADRDLVFIGLTSDAHWRRFCAAFGFDDLAADPHLAANNDRIDRRDRLLPELRRRVALREKAEIMALAEGAGIPFAPIAKPQDLFEDPQLNASGGLVETRLPDGRTVRLPKIPLRMGERDFGLRRHPPAPGEGSEDLLRSLGIGPERAAELEAAGILVRRPEGGG
jgi:crotonobetainyl-CoA:carnitine CoA-transferase CaiB-like acyl-CoA transferase